MEKKKLYKDMTVEEQLRYVTDLTTFIDDKLPRLEHLGDAWERADRKDMETGLALLCAFQFARDFVDKALRYGDFSARARRLRVYIDKIKQEVAKGLSLKGSDGHTYALVQATVPQRRRGRPTLQQQAAREQGIATPPAMDAAMERQVKIARLMGIEVIIDPTTAPRELNNAELAAQRQRKAAEEAKLNPSLFSSPSPSAPSSIPSSTPSSVPSSTPSSVLSSPSVQSAAVSQQPTPTVARGSATSIPDTPVYRLHLDQKAPFLSIKPLRDECAMVHGLRTTAAAEAERAKTLADVGADADTIAPHAQRAQEALEAYENIYQKIDEDLATTYYRLLNDGDFREKWLRRFHFRSMEDVSKDLLYDLRLHYRKVQSPEFDHRINTLIEQESPEYAARMKAEAEKKKEIQFLLRYIRRTDKPITKTRLAGLKNRLARLAELDPDEARVQAPIVRKAEEELSQKESGKNPS